MKNLLGLLRNLCFHFMPGPFQGPVIIGRTLTATVTIAGMGFATGHPVITLHHLDLLLQAVVVLVICAVVANVLHSHVNDFLKVLVRERRKSKRNAQLTAELVKELLRPNKKPGGTPGIEKDAEMSKKSVSDDDSEQSQ